jgi:hypothetical protein
MGSLRRHRERMELHWVIEEIRDRERMVVRIRAG